MKVIKKILLLLLIFAAAVALYLVVQKYRYKEQKQMEQLHLLRTEVAPYEAELTNIRETMALLKKEKDSKKAISSVTIGFVPRSVEDVSKIRSEMKNRKMNIALLLDCSSEESLLKEILEEAEQDSFEYTFFASKADAKALEKANHLREFLQEKNSAQEYPFLLRLPDDSPGNLEILEENEYHFFIRFRNDYMAGILESGTPYLSYSFIRNDPMIANVVEEIIEAFTNSMIIFDYIDISSENMKESDITEVLNRIERYIKNEKLKSIPLTEQFVEIINKEDQVVEKNKAYEKYVEDKQKRIEELEVIIHEIYDRYE